MVVAVVVAVAVAVWGKRRAGDAGVLLQTVV
jgi:hypothetical protein